MTQQELLKAVLSLPIGFIVNDGQPIPVAIQGLKPGQNLLIDDSGKPINHPEVAELFGEFLGDSYAVHTVSRH